MSRRWRIALPLLVGAAVFGVGLWLDGADMEWHWQLLLLYLGPGLLLPAFTGLMSLKFAWWAVAYFRHACGDYTQGDRFGYSAYEGDCLVGRWEALRFTAQGAFGALLFGPFTLGLLFFAHWNFDGYGGLLLPTFWLTNAGVAGGLAAALIAGWFADHSRRRLLLPLAVFGVISAGVVLLTVWPGCWEHSRYGYYDRRANWARRSTDEAVYWADRMVELRPTDWRGYARRVDGRQKQFRPAEESRDDVHRAVTLGCDDPRVRHTFSELYSRMGRHGEAADELDVAIGLAQAKARWPKQFKYDVERWTAERAFARLHGGQYDLATEMFNATWSSVYPGHGYEQTEGLAMLHIALGDYPAAMRLLVACTNRGSEVVTRAWLLATCPTAELNNPEEAVRLCEADVLAGRWHELRDSDQLVAEQLEAGLTVDYLREGNGRYMFHQQVLKRAQALVRAAAFTNMGQFEEAEAAYLEATEMGLLGKSGFWMQRREELGECIKARRPYRDRPAR